MPFIGGGGGTQLPPDLLQRIEALEEGAGGNGVVVSPTQPEDPAQAPVWVKTTS